MVVALAAMSSAATLSLRQSPDNFDVTFSTDVKQGDGKIVINVVRDAAPLGADQFYTLVKAGFFNEAAYFRVVPGFVVQFGISGNKTLNNEFSKPIKDDPVKLSNTKGTIVFADAGPNTRTTQLFINYADNSRLDAMGFAPFGSVTSGMDVATQIFNPTPGNSGGIDQDQYEANGNDWIRKNYPGTNFITSAEVTPSN